MDNRQIYLRFAKPYVEDDVKQLDSKIEKIIPQIINVNRYIQNIVEKIVEVPIIV